MIGLDTNVLVRFLVDDDPAQNHAARTFLSERNADDPAFLSAVALAETVWVLSRRLGYAAKDIASMLRGLLASDGLIIEHADELGAMLGHGALPDADLADHLIAWANRHAGCRTTVTFDRRAAKVVTGMDLLT